MSPHYRKTATMAVLLTVSFAGPVFANDKPHSLQVVAVPVTNMYSSPSKQSDVVSQAILGSNVALLKKKHKWAQVQTSDNYTGWVPTEALHPTSSPAFASGTNAVQVSSLFANVYSETDVTTHAPLVTLPFEARLERIDEAPQPDARWLHVRLPDGRTGFIQHGDITLTPKLLTIPESIELAKRFLGIPYLWGGRSSFGYDCSGFTQMLVRSRGISMPRDADQQANWDGVAPINRQDLQPGDLLFFGESDKKITHTGMYIGNGQFIHDTTNTHPVVQISTLDDDPWTHLLVASRRVK